MKRLIVFFALTLMVGIAMDAAKTRVPVAGTKKSLDDTSKVIRVPFNPPIEIYFDEDTREIEIVPPSSSYMGVVYMKDEYMNNLEYSPVLNCIMYVPEEIETYVFIYMFGDNWDAKSTILL